MCGGEGSINVTVPLMTYDGDDETAEFMKLIENRYITQWRVDIIIKNILSLLLLLN